MSTTNRAIQDAALAVTVAAANANASTYSAAIDLGQTTIFPVNEKVGVVLSVPAIANLANTKTETFTLEHADVNLNANYSAISGLSTIVITGGASGGVAADTNVRLPGATKQFLRVRADGGANAGTTLTESATLSLRF